MIHFVFWFFVLYLIEKIPCKKICRRGLCEAEDHFTPTTNLDEDVQKEIARVQKGTSDSDLVIKVDGLRKVYPRNKCFSRCGKKQSVVAVENLSFGIGPGECFALLGVNGAGKSSTFKTLTSEI